MGKFEDKKKELREQVQAKEKETGKKRVTFSEAAFNSLATALMNDPEYEDVSIGVKDGKPVNNTSKPVADLRKVMIGSVLKGAGVDAAETASLVATHEFPTLPMYGYTAALLEHFTDTGKGFTFPKRDDFECTLRMETIPETTKITAAPGKKGEERKTFTQVYGQHRRMKVKSSCPAGRRTKLS